VSYFCGAFWRQDYGYDVEAEGALGYVVGSEKIAGGPEQFAFFGIGDGPFGRAEDFIGPGPDLDKDEAGVGIDHNQVDFAGAAGEVADECF